MKNHLIILEGADRVGKSTYANQLSTQLGYPIEHFGKPNQEIIKNTERYFYQYEHLLANPQDRILDRSWVSRLFYTTLRDFRSTDLKLFYHLHYELQKHYYIYYIFINRKWDQALRNEHQNEIKLGCGYGTIKERKREHYAFILLFKLLKNTPLTMLTKEEFEELDIETLRPLIKDWLDLLTPKQLQVISLLYGLNSENRILKLVQLSEKLEVSINTIVKHKDRAFNHLNHPKFKPLKAFLLDDRFNPTN